MVAVDFSYPLCPCSRSAGYLAFNYKGKEFRSQKVRRASAHAINRPAVVEALYGGTGLVATQFQPPGLWGANPSLRAFGWDAQKARALLAEIDQKQRAALYRQAEQMIHDDVARLFIAHNQPPLALLKSVQGYVTHPTGIEYFNSVRITGRAN